jgi:ABC-type nitrate/sulfonate/bicarbonate transport system substrate-binding protein
MTKRLRIGYVPLTDAALLQVAKAQHFAAARVEIEPVADSPWAGSVRKGKLDGFCVGAPWNSLAVAAGVGTLLHQGTNIVRDCPEKVLAFRAEWARSHGDDVRAHAGAVDDASRWAAAPGNRNSLRTLLTSTAWQGVSPWTIERGP